MLKLTISFLLFTSILSAKAHNPYTIILCNTQNIQNAKNFIKKYLEQAQQNIYIIKSTKTYVTTYGAFKNYKEAKKYKLSLPKKLLNLKPYILKSSHDLEKGIIQGSLLEVIPFKPKFQRKKISYEPIHETVFPTMYQKKKNTVLSYQRITNHQYQNKRYTQARKKILIKNQEKQQSNLKKIIQKKVVNLDTSKLENEFKYKVSLEYSPLRIKGDNQFKGGSKISLSDDLNIKKSNTSLTPQISLHLGKHSAFVSYNTNKLNSQKRLTKDYTLGTNSFSKNTIAQSSLENTIVNTGYRYKYLNSNIGFDLQSFQNDLNIYNSSASTNVNSSFIIPSLSIDMKHKLNTMLFNYGTSYGINKNISYQNIYFGIGVQTPFINNSSVFVGYRAKKYEIEKADYNLDLHYQGGYLNFTKEF